MTQRQAFTLIELLVVIAIIAILAAILFPVFAQAREKARSTTCLSNFKQLGSAVIMYIQDYDGNYPLAWYNTPAYGFDCVLLPYVKNLGVYDCPSNVTAPRLWNGYVTFFKIAPPGIAVALVILACTMVGRSLEDTLNPRLRVGHLSVRRFRLRDVPGKPR